MRSDVGDADRPRYAWNLANILALVYMWWFMATPMFAPRLEFLAAWRFEKILAVAFLMAACARGRIDRLFQPISIVLGVLFIWMVVCSLFSPYADSAPVLHWQDYYWKQLVFFAALTISLRTVADMRTIIVGVGAILFFYQLHSWFDFLQGGSYVYQQGMKRMKGVWADSGYGAGNAWGYLGLFGVPLSLACYRLATNSRWKRTSVAFFVVTFLCILFSGGRGALISSCIYVAVVFRRHLPRFKAALVVMLLLGLGFPLLPDDVQHRVLSLVRSVDQETATVSDQIASDSAKGRIQGLYDGLEIASRSPLVGCGPAASAFAAAALDHNEEQRQSEGADALQLHNLYGQLAAELGYPGVAIWLALIAMNLWQVRKVWSRYANGHEPRATEVTIFCGFASGCMAVFLIYGMAGHTLYDYRWLFLFAVINALGALEPVPGEC